MNVSIIGCGGIGSRLAEAIKNGQAGDTHLISVYDTSAETAQRVASSVGVKVARTVGEVLEDRQVEIVVEAASQRAVREYALRILEAGKNLFILSTGALLDNSLLQELVKTAKMKRIKIFVPSGAAVGIDGIKANAIVDPSEVIVEFRKPPHAWRGIAPHLQRKVDSNSSKEPFLIFEGSPTEAVELLPTSVNVSATVSLVGLDSRKIRVRAVVDSSLDRSLIRVHAKSKACEMTAETKNVLLREPHASYLTIISALRKLQDLSETLSVGT